MRLIDAEGSELQTQLKIIREAEYQIYGSGSWGFTAKCEHAIEDAPTVQPEPHWIPCGEELPKEEGFYLVTIEFKHGAETNIRYFKIENSERYWSKWGNENITAWMPKPIPYQPKREVTE